MAFTVPKNYFVKNYFSTDAYDTYETDVLSWVNLTAKKIFSFIKYSPHPKILDVGCAHGFLIAEFQNKYNVRVAGLEYSDYARKTAQKEVRLKIKKGSILNDSIFSESEFDAVICFDVFIYLNKEETKKAVRNLSFWSNRFVFFSTLYKHSKQNSQKINPDKYRITALTQNEYIKIFADNGLDFISKFNSGNGGEILVFKKRRPKEN